MAERRDISTSSWKGAPEPRGVAEPEAKAARESDDLPFGVVGIGASAGGIDAFRSLLGALPADTGMAYVVVQHLSPDHPSFLAQTLARFASMPVLEIQDGTRLVPDHVYVLPSNAEVLLSRGTLRLVPRPPSPGGRLPIDALFLSLARELRCRAIGVVLSGTGEDGTAGLKEIKAEGGLTFAQTSASAHFTGMPESASAAGVVDRVPRPDREQAGRSDPDLGARVLHQRGGLQPRDQPARVLRRVLSSGQRIPDLRLRLEPEGRRVREGGTLPGGGTARPGGRSPGAVLPSRRGGAEDRQGHPRSVRVRRPRSGTQSPLRKARPHQLPQRAHLLRSGAPSAPGSDVPLLPESRRVPPARPEREPRRLR